MLSSGMMSGSFMGIRAEEYISSAWKIGGLPFIFALG